MAAGSPRTARLNRRAKQDACCAKPRTWCWRERGSLPGSRVSTLDLLGPGITVFTGPRGHPGAAAAATAGPPPVTVRTLDGMTARALGIAPGMTAREFVDIVRRAAAKTGRDA